MTKLIKIYLASLVIVSVAITATGERHYPLPGNNRFMEVRDSIKVMSDKDQVLDKYKNIMAFNYADSCVMVLTGSVELFQPEIYEFEHGFDAIKYWYEPKIFNISMSVSEHPDTTSNIYVYTRFDDLFFGLYYKNGDSFGKPDSSHPTTLIGAMFNLNDPSISYLTNCKSGKPYAIIGDSSDKFIASLNLATPVSTDGIRSIEILPVASDASEDINHRAVFTIKNDTIESFTYGDIAKLSKIPVFPKCPTDTIEGYTYTIDDL